MWVLFTCKLNVYVCSGESSGAVMWSANNCFGSIAVYVFQDSEVLSVEMVGITNTTS